MRCLTVECGKVVKYHLNVSIKETPFRPKKKDNIAILKCPCVKSYDMIISVRAM